MKKALITGITGQDGSYLAELLINKGYEVHGMVRRSSSHNRGRIDYLRDSELYTTITPDKKGSFPAGNLILNYGDLTDSSSIEKAIREVNPDEVYNLGAQSQVRISFDIPEYTSNTVGLGTLRILEAIKNICPDTRFYQASSSEMFGKVLETPQTEETPFYPRSPYACAKVEAYHLTRNYREAYGMHASNGILFNHESERRGESFVTRKITRNLARIKMGLQKSFSLGNLDSKRDWGHAEDYVKAMWLILQQDEPEDYVIGTGENHSVREFLEESAKCLDMQIHSNEKEGIEEKYLNEKNQVILEINPYYFRPTEVDTLLSNSTKAREKLGWKPKISFNNLVRRMADSDLELAEKESRINHRIKNY